MNLEWFTWFTPIFLKQFNVEKSCNPATFLTGTSSVSVEVKHEKFALPYIEVRAEERGGREGGGERKTEGGKDRAPVYILCHF